MYYGVYGEKHLKKDNFFFVQAEHRGIYAQVRKIATLGGSLRLSLRLGEG